MGQVKRKFEIRPTKGPKKSQRKKKPKRAIKAWRAIVKITKKHKLFSALVVFPTLTSLVYFSFFASDIYISESKFLIRGPEPNVSPLSGLLGGQGVGTAFSDTNGLLQFFGSRESLKALEESLSLRSSFSSDSIDRFSRYRGFSFSSGTFEDLYDYYQSKVTIDIDQMSMITTLQTRAFSPEMAYEMNLELLEMGEEKVNQLNERANEDLMKFARQELAAAEEAAREASVAHATYRRQTSNYDPSTHERLLVGKEIAIKQLEMRHEALVLASDSAQKQSVYLVRLVSPFKADEALEPRRIEKVLGTLIIGFFLWGVLSMLLAGVREHHD